MSSDEEHNVRVSTQFDPSKEDLTSYFKAYVRVYAALKAKGFPPKFKRVVEGRLDNTGGDSTPYVDARGDLKA